MASADGPDAELSAEVREQRDRVREMWLALAPEPDEVELRLWAESDNDPRPAREAAHREAIDALVAAGDLGATVAELVQLAFAEVSYHHWRLRAVGMTCYAPDPRGGVLRDSRERLCQRLLLLDELVGSGAVSDEAVADARSALAYELAIYDAVDDFERHEGVLRWNSEAELDDWLESGRVTADADELEAASWLVEVLLASRRSHG